MSLMALNCLTSPRLGLVLSQSIEQSMSPIYASVMEDVNTGFPTEDETDAVNSSFIFDNIRKEHVDLFSNDEDDKYVDIQPNDLQRLHQLIVEFDQKPATTPIHSLVLQSINYLIISC